MRKGACALLVTFAAALSAGEQGKSSSTSASGLPADAAPLYRVTFERRDAVAGISATGAFTLPFGCTIDGTIFIDFVSGVPANSGLPPQPPIPPPALLTSISPVGTGQTFRLDQVPELYISSEVDHYASESDVIFLVRASKENKPTKQAYSVGSYHGEYTTNAAEQHLYVVSFNRNGEYRRAFEIDEDFQIERLGVFESGVFLTFGLDAKDHSPKLAMLKEDGTLLKFLEIPKGDAPEQLATSHGRGFNVASSELITVRSSIIIVQNQTGFPLLEVSESGTIKTIHARLPDGEQVESVIPSDRGLYVIAGPPSAERGSREAFYEVSADDGTLMRRFELSEGRTASDVACIHDGKFLSIDYGSGKVVPLVGSAEPVTAADQQKR